LLVFAVVSFFLVGLSFILILFIQLVRGRPVAESELELFIADRFIYSNAVQRELLNEAQRVEHREEVEPDLEIW